MYCNRSDSLELTPIPAHWLLNPGLFRLFLRLIPPYSNSHAQTRRTTDRGLTAFVGILLPKFITAQKSESNHDRGLWNRTFPKKIKGPPARPFYARPCGRSTSAIADCSEDATVAKSVQAGKAMPSKSSMTSTESLERLMKLVSECSRDGWDGYRATAVTAGAVANATRLIRALPSDLCSLVRQVCSVESEMF